MNHSRQVSRRNVLRTGVVLASSTAIAAVIIDPAGASPALPTGDSAPRSLTGKRADLGRVASRDHEIVTLGTPKMSAGNRVESLEEVRYVGFPENIVPRPGDLVTVVEDWPGIALAAVPLCHWVTGVPKTLANGEIGVSGARLVASPELHTKKIIRVCVLDTELETAQVLAIRAA